MNAKTKMGISFQESYITLYKEELKNAKTECHREWAEMLLELPCRCCENALKIVNYAGMDSKRNKHFLPSIFCKILFAYIIDQDTENVSLFVDCSNYIDESKVRKKQNKK